MKKALIVALIAGTASTVTAAPRESVTFTAVNSVGWTNNPANETRTVTFTGSDAGGAYTARYLTLSGTVSPIAAGTFTREAVIEITAPGGQTFIAAPLNTFDSPTPVSIDAGRYVVPIGAFTTAGVWTFRFSELYDDDAGGPDQVWDTITFTLDDAPPPATVIPSPGVTVPFTDVNSDGALGAGNVVTTNVVAPGNINGIQIVGRLTMKTGSTIQNLNNGPFQARIRITPPASTGLAPFDVNPGVGGVSTGTANVSVSIPGAPSGGIPAAGLWTFEFWELEDEPTGVDAVWQNISFTFRNSTPPVSTDFPTLVDGGASVEESDFVTMAVPTAANTVTWLRVTVPTTISSGAGSAMDLDMVGSNGTPENDFNFGLYNSDGVRMANSFNTGPGLLPQVSFGAGTRTRNGDGLPYDGQNPALSPAGNTTTASWPPVPSGIYYLAVTSGDTGAAYGPGLWSVVPSTENNGPTANVRIRYYSNAPTVVPPSQDLGVLGGTETGVANMPADAGARFKWYKFTLPQEASDTSGKYVDIDTANTGEPMNDTNIALYDSAGTLKSFNDDIAPGWGAANPTGGNSAMSFGMGATPRDYSAINANLPQGDGRDGVLAAGDYYLQVSMCCAGYGNDRFWVQNDYVTNPDVGNINWAIRTNYDETGPLCGAADLGSTGGVPGADDHLDNNDFVVFIDFFFAQNPLADQGSTGGVPGPDGTWDNNDFVVFIDNFFNAPASCR